MRNGRLNGGKRVFRGWPTTLRGAAHASAVQGKPGECSSGHNRGFQRLFDRPRQCASLLVVAKCVLAWMFWLSTQIFVAAHYVGCFVPRRRGPGCGLLQCSKVYIMLQCTKLHILLQCTKQCILRSGVARCSSTLVFSHVAVRCSGSVCVLYLS